MRWQVTAAAVLAVFSGTGCVGWAQNSATKSASPSDKLVERGKYIVEGLSRCEQCHTPKDNMGNPIPSKSLDGASLWLQSARPVANWPLKAPRLAGNPPGTDEEMVTLLTTGVWRDGKPLRPPMPQFRMTREDAEAVVAFLKSLNPQPE